MDQPAPSIARVELFPKDATPLPENASVFLDMLVVKFSCLNMFLLNISMIAKFIL